MTRKFFGTDGIRGRANEFPMTAEMAMRVAMAAAVTIKQAHRGNHQDRIVIGKDTRLSGYMLEQAMTAGFLAMGIDVVLLGPIPTPGVAMLTRSLRADMGVMISASHNPYEDNGIKLFGADGYKLDDGIEAAIERTLGEDLSQRLSKTGHMGKASRLDDALGRYVEYVKSTFPRGSTLQGIKVVVDCAHGAGYKAAPQILWELEAEVVAIGNKPDGKNINLGCGATDTDLLARTVLAEGADIGLALDGDGDRVILVDDEGEVIDGDHILALLATDMRDKGMLRGEGIVATVMSNLGLERYLAGLGLGFQRACVGDRYVMEEMRNKGCNLGGEQSGHIILSDYSTTGDGLMAGLQALDILVRKGGPASRTLRLYDCCPQVLKSVAYKTSSNPLENRDVIEAIRISEGKIKDRGRLLVRTSGTQSVIRIMAEGDDRKLIETIVDTLSVTIGNAGKALEKVRKKSG